MRQNIHLSGCAPAPLAHYLKALAVLRLVAEQRDPEARGFWHQDCFVLRTKFGRDDLLNFFLKEYAPTPVIAPWNGGSGFFPKDQKRGLEAIEKSQDQRFVHYRNAIKQAQKVLEKLGVKEKPEKHLKGQILGRLRASVPETALRWLDAAVVLGDGDPVYPPLLGTGGNDGRLDFTNNFMQRLAELLIDTSPASRAMLQASLFDQAIAGLSATAIGQFHPGAVGGPNSGCGFEGAPPVSPWDFIFMIEGAVVFASAVTRRLEHGDASAVSFPFTVKSSGSGSEKVAMDDEGEARAEMWMPLWDKPASFPEVERLFSEGRLVLKRSLARNALDAARAVARLGVDRGISNFYRYSFLKRSGRAYLATPIGSFPVTRNPKADVIDDLDRDGWLASFRRFARQKETPAVFVRLLRGLEDALFILAKRGDPQSFQKTLDCLGRIDQTVGMRPKACEALRPVPWLSPDWAVHADDGSCEFRIALALASVGQGKAGLPMRVHVMPVAEEGRRLSWNPESPLAVWDRGDLLQSLRDLVDKKLLMASDDEAAFDACFDGSRPAGLREVRSFLAGETDDHRIKLLVPGLSCIKLPWENPTTRAAPNGMVRSSAVFAVFKLLFTPRKTLRSLGWLPEGVALPVDRRLVALLFSAEDFQAKTALALAVDRLRASGVPVPFHRRGLPSFAGLDPKRVLGSLAIPVGYGDTVKLIQSIMI